MKETQRLVLIEKLKPWIEAMNEDISDRPGVDESVIKRVADESYDGYIALNDGGWQIETKANLYKAFSRDAHYPNCMESYANPTHEDLEDYDDDSLEFMRDIDWWYKAYCFLKDGKAVFQIYLCLDEHGRDYISWLVHMGGNPKQTVGTWEVIIPVDEIEVRLPEITKSALDELERLQTTERNV